MFLANPNTRKDPAALADFMSKEDVIFAYLTPTQLSLLLELAGGKLIQCHNWRLALMCGGRLPPRLAREFYDLGLPAKMYNPYGLSETVVQNVSQEVAYPVLDNESIPIGFGLDNNRLFVVDQALHPLLVGLPAELCISGAMLGTGYRNLPSKTRDSFDLNLFCSEEDRSRGWKTMFRSGDAARFRDDGALEFMGRINGDKDQASGASN
jgi:non-ribosomal peptide synthetase component F